MYLCMIKLLKRRPHVITYTANFQIQPASSRWRFVQTCGRNLLSNRAGCGVVVWGGFETEKQNMPPPPGKGKGKKGDAPSRKTKCPVHKEKDGMTTLTYEWAEMWVNLTKRSCKRTIYAQCMHADRQDDDAPAHSTHPSHMQLYALHPTFCIHVRDCTPMIRMHRQDHRQYD